MKKLAFLFLCLSTLLVIGCSSALPQKPHVVQGAKMCGSDAECDPGMYCGFKEIDSYPVCKY